MNNSMTISRLEREIRELKNAVQILQQSIRSARRDIAALCSHIDTPTDSKQG